MYTRSKWLALITVCLVLGSLLAACAAPPPAAAPTAAPVVVKETVVVTEEKVVEKQVTSVVEKQVEKVITATPEPEKHAAEGGTMVFSIPDPDTFDPPMSSDGNAMGIAMLLGGTLLSQAPDGSITPYLAESWTTSADGSQIDFKLRKDVKFHDGTPMTAKDFVYAINRIKDPKTAAVQAGRAKSIKSAEALDDYTLRLTLAYPDPFILNMLSSTAVIQPLSQSYVEAKGKDFGKEFNGTGPYMLQEWTPGKRVVLKRNPDFKWAPAWAKNKGPAYIDTIEYRLLNDPATVLAGLEAGEIDYSDIGTDDLSRVEGQGDFSVIEYHMPGMLPSLHMNDSKEPFTDIKVRQAFNSAVDRDALIKIILQGHGVPQYGPLNPEMPEYWKGVESIGYKFDLDKAKKLMEEAGYKPGADGILEKDGKPLQLKLDALQPDTQLAEMLKEQLKALGVDLTIQMVDAGAFTGNMFSGAFDTMITGYGATTPGTMGTWYGTNPGNFNLTRHADDQALNDLINAMNTAGTAEKALVPIQDIQRRVVEQAYVVPLYSPTRYIAVNKRVQGVDPVPGFIVGPKFSIYDAYIETK